MINGFVPALEGNYRHGRSAPVQYIVVHYTANRGDTAKNNVDYFSRTLTKTSAHYFVDEKGAWQSVGDNNIAYHCGAKTYKHPTCRNSNSIGVEICMLDTAGKIRMTSIRQAIDLVRMLMELHGIPASNVIRHYDVTGKACPAPMVTYPKLWEVFKADLGGGDEVDRYPDWARQVYNWLDEVPDWARASVQKAVKVGAISTNDDNSITVLGCNLQGIVMLDRLGLLG